MSFGQNESAVEAVAAKSQSASAQKDATTQFGGATDTTTGNEVPPITPVFGQSDSGKQTFAVSTPVFGQSSTVDHSAQPPATPGQNNGTSQKENENPFAFSYANASSQPASTPNNIFGGDNGNKMPFNGDKLPASNNFKPFPPSNGIDPPSINGFSNSVVSEGPSFAGNGFSNDGTIPSFGAASVQQGGASGASARRRAAKSRGRRK
jgi:hypothetical protein